MSFLDILMVRILHIPLIIQSIMFTTLIIVATLLLWKTMEKPTISLLMTIPLMINILFTISIYKNGDEFNTAGLLICKWDNYDSDMCKKYLNYVKEEVLKIKDEEYEALGK